MDFSAFFRALLFCAFLSAAQGLHIAPHDIDRLLLPAYDYIVVGGGVAGLVVAHRLSEHPDVTVLVLEAGSLDSSPDIITVPGLVGHGIVPAYNWNLSTTRQEFLDNNTRYYDQGHVVGGGSILNGLLMTRGAKADYDAWQSLGNPGWNWHRMLHYFKKSERFAPVTCREHVDPLHIHPHMPVHGTKGPLQVGYPNFFYNQSANFLQGIAELGVPILSDPNAGVSAGASVAPSSIMARNQSRADSRRAYLDHVLHRPNLHLASQQTVTRVLMSDLATGGFPLISKRLKKAYAVEFRTSAESPQRNAFCNREVILAAGAILSPAILQVSGIGPASVLEELDVPIQVNLPGVGANLQDHAMVHAFYNYTAPGLFSSRNLTGAVLREVEEQYFTNRTGPWTHPLISTIAFPHLSHLTSMWPSLLSNITSSPESYLPPGPGRHPTLLKGYTHQLRQLKSLLSDSTVGAIEIMADSVGTLTISIQHPLSRGFVRALSSDLLANGSVARNIHLDPRYCSHPLDCDLILQGLRFNSRLIATEAMKKLQPRPESPWNTTDENILNEAIRSQVVTEYHPSGTTSMMPLNMGGVVNTRLTVYGTANLRVVDAGTIPLLPAAHIQAAVYAVAERAAAMIEKDNPSPMASGIPGAPLGPGIVKGSGQ